MYKQEFPSTIPTYPYKAQIVEIVWLFQKWLLPLHPMMSHKTAGGSVSGVL
jgi:hypothetical protein